MKKYTPDVNNVYTKQQRIVLAIFSAVGIIVFAFIVAFSIFKKNIFDHIYQSYQAPVYISQNAWIDEKDYITTGDIYVSTSGDDSNPGTSDYPVRTLQKVSQLIQAIDKTNHNEIIVCISPGEYYTNALTLNGGSVDCRIKYVATGEGVIINSGLSLSSDDFKPASEYPALSSRLSHNKSNKILAIDLTQAPYNLTPEDWGKIYPIGAYNTGSWYSGDSSGPMYCELFIDNKRQSLARYPNQDYLYTGDVIQSGREQTTTQPSGDPYGDVYLVDSDLASRISSWQTTDDVWAYGSWKYDWADGSSPISFDPLSSELTVKYQSFFGARSGAPYYFFNCLDELDCEGEWYLDRTNGLLCIYGQQLTDSNIELSLSLAPAITINDSFVTLNGLTILGSRGNGIVINGNNNEILNCTVKCVSGCGIQSEGYNNTFYHNEIMHTGRGGIHVSGGDRESLTPGQNVVDNNLIHDWAEVYKMYNVGISLYGVGNACSHNELYNAPHIAVTYSGNNNIIEYNLIHSVCLEVEDSGAIYAGRSWTSYGNEIRYNCIYNIGSEKHHASGIYLDDALSGQKVYGNLLINIPKYAIFIGGGRDNDIYDNTIINAGECAIRYDARAREGILSETWFSDHVRTFSGDLWTDLLSSPWMSETWQAAYPQYATLSTNLEDIDRATFLTNPANSKVYNNLIFDRGSSVGIIDEDVVKYSEIKNNLTYYISDLRKHFKHYLFGDYTLDTHSSIYHRLDSFNYSPINHIGRY